MTTIVVGLAPGERGGAAVHLGAMVARSTDSPLVVAAINPAPWPPNPFLGDEEYLELQQAAAEETFARSRMIIGGDLSAEYLVETARSVTDGLLQVSTRSEAGLVVLGSGTSGLPGRVSLGSVAQRILHSLDTPVCFAPADFSVPTGARLSRITVGFGRADHDSGLLAAALDPGQAVRHPAARRLLRRTAQHGSSRQASNHAPRTWWSASGPSSCAPRSGMPRRSPARTPTRWRSSSEPAPVGRRRWQQCPGLPPICWPSAPRPPRSVASCSDRTRPRSSSTLRCRC